MASFFSSSSTFCTIRATALPRQFLQSFRCRRHTEISFKKAHFHNSSPHRTKSTPNNPPTPISTAPAKSSSIPTSLSIPGPSWLWVQPLTYPFRAYSRVQSRHPYIVQLTSSIIIYFLGDLSSQSIQARSSTPTVTSPTTEALSTTGTVTAIGQTKPYDRHRALRSVVIGAISSIPSYHFFLWLSKSFNVTGRPYTSLLLKVAFNQLTFAPLFNAYFFSMQSLLSFSEGPQPAAAWRRVRETVPTSWINSCKFWPAVTAFSFTFVPVQHRSIFAGVVAIGWQTYLGMLNQRAAAKERDERAKVTTAMVSLT